MRHQSIAEQVKAEALESVNRRNVARQLSAAAGAKLSVGAHIQMIELEAGPGSARGMIRESWPETHDLLGRLSAALGERPLPLLVRLINDEAARKGLRRTGEV